MTEQSPLTPTDKIVTELRVWARAYSTAAPIRYVMSRAADALADSARRERVAAEKTLADINFLWDWRINQGYPFLHFTADAQVMRAILAGERLEDQPEFDWVTKVRAEESDD